MKITKKILSYFIVLITYSVSVFAFDWPLPMENVKENSVHVKFAEKRIDNFSSGFVFASNEQDVKVCENGKVLFFRNNKNQRYDKFCSSLGIYAVVAHADKVISVYGNLLSFEREILSLDSMEEGLVLGKVSGNFSKDSGFHEKNETLEFQLLDTKNKVAINPVLLLPALENRFIVSPGPFYLVNKKNVNFRCDERRNIPFGTYSLYRDFSATNMPLKTVISVNGIDVSVVNYDTLVVKNGVLTVLAKNNLPFAKIYSDEKKQFLGDIDLVRGKNSITLTVTDYNKIDRKITYTIDVY